MKHELPQLPYANDALVKVLSEETLNFHFGKHERAYFDNLNKLIEGTKYSDMNLVEIIRNSEGGIFNNAAQAWNHLFYFLALSPDAAQEPTGELKSAIDAQYGNLDEFKKQFEAAGATLFGSGWVWLSVDKSGKLFISQGKNAETPLTNPDLKPIMCFDVWEHAYYLDYQNRRPEYLHKLWDVLDWNVVSRRFSRDIEK